MAVVQVDEDLRKKLDGVVLNESIMIARDVIVDLYTAFEKFMRFAGPVLYNAAKKAGRLMAQRLMERGVIDESNALDALLWSFVRAGYASEVKVLEDKVEKNKRVIRIGMKGTLLGAKIQRKKPVDAPLAGFAAGWLEAVWGKKVDAKEVACLAKGDDMCVFEIVVK
ncbi:4-vinyl reductase 4VR [Pyrolobus fumarii 1A]|uniref:4-vinyl reductase 4VR n=1 Tax=Pyrolobus fumarii (strain DSM 11204 / 1A) TaxID=694429 RepID=G0EE43_PYRF1|nr:V4R domain-containing protein [Pyrolobus fumarii]AEM37959.1 4-vinyl reductase 4VR [Pyrolobus fumarii 1A]